MKKKLCFFMVVLATGMIASLNINNVEALASESPLGYCVYHRNYKCCLLASYGEGCTPWNRAWF